MSCPRALAVAGLLASCTAPRVVAPLRYLEPAPVPDEPFRLTAPPLAAVTEVAPPEVEVSALPNGMRLIFLERHDVAAVSVRLLIPRNPFDPDDPASVRLAQMAFLYSHGSEDAIERRLGQSQGSGVWVRELIGTDALVWAAHGTSEMLDLTGELVARRSFGAVLTAAEYERRGDEWLRAVHLGGGAAWAAERYVLFGDRHPYGYAGWGRTLVSLPDARRLRASLLQPARATLLVVGDTTFAQAHEVAQRWFGALASSSTPAPEATPPAASDFVAAQLVYAAGGGLQQLCSIVGQGPVAGPEEADALQVLSHLVSDPGSTLMEEVRGDLGATYGVRAAVIRQRFATWIAISGHYARGKELDAMAAALEQLKRIRTGTIRDEELQRAREEAMGQWRGALASVEDMADYYGDAIARGDDLASVADQPQRLLRIGPKEVAQAATRYLGADRLHVVITGVPTGLEEIRLGLGRAERVRLVR